MGVARWLFNDWFTAHELDQLDSKLASQSRRDERQDQRIEALRADLERVSLLAKSLADLCLEHGVLTRDQLRERMFELDLSDGRQDGRLDLGAKPLDPA
jgi:hypothetical protein